MTRRTRIFVQSLGLVFLGLAIGGLTVIVGNGAPVTDPVLRQQVALTAAPIVRPNGVSTGAQRCTSTAVTPTMLLTARHCFVVNAADSLPGTILQRVSVAWQTGAGMGTPIETSVVAVDAALDLAALCLVSGTLPSHFPRALKAPVKGLTFTTAGYGLNGNPSGILLAGQSRVDSTTARHFVGVAAPASPCKGDSGGPAFVKEGLIGIQLQFVGASACGKPVRFVRVDTSAFAQFLASAESACSSRRSR